VSIVIAESTNIKNLDEQIERLLLRVYVEGGFTEQSIAQRIFISEEVKKRGDILFALSPPEKILGMVICSSRQNPYKQIAYDNEAEMHLLAVDPDARNLGLGELLIKSFEKKAGNRGFLKAVLSTQKTMGSAQGLYVKMGYHRDPSRDWSRGGRDFLVFTKALE
jgi:ribosomal protein S18 acetylase RimI-like enzyme